jgi:hypothetical protein
MGHCYHHALSSVRKWGGVAEDYLPLHQWFDESKAITADFRHRALRHHAEGIFMLERFFGPTITISTGRVVPVRLIGEQHVVEDLGFIPSFADWVSCIRPQPWMGRAQPIHKLVDPFAVTSGASTDDARAAPPLLDASAATRPTRWPKPAASPSKTMAGRGRKRTTNPRAKLM